MDLNDFLELCVVYEDLPDLIELGVRVRSSEWSAASTAYTSPSFLADSGKAILEWVKAPQNRLRIEAGANTGIGWMVLEFYTVDRACHARCAVTLATGYGSRDSWPEETSRFAIELPTEIGLIERFARECIGLGSRSRPAARLIALPHELSRRKRPLDRARQTGDHHS